MTKLSSLSTDQLLDMCADFIARDGIEGRRLAAYRCQAGKITIGDGLANKYPNGTLIKMGDTCTKEQAASWTKDYIKKNCLSTVNKYYAKIPDAETFVALISLAYNSGELGESIVAALEKPVLDKNELAAAFRLYNKFTNPDTGQKEVSQGLVNRREAEIKYFMGG